MIPYPSGGDRSFRRDSVERSIEVMDEMTAICAQGLVKAFPMASGQGVVEILHGIDCQIPAGRMTAMVGPSGSGKSTALLCLSGLEPITSGSVHLLGQDLGGLGAGKVARLYRDRVGFVFQAYNLVPYLSVSENIALSDVLAGRRPDRAKIASTLTELGLESHRDAATTTLSGGQQQRVALGRVLYRHPEIIFADEPTGALDTGAATMVLGRLRDLADQGHTVVLVTHDLQAASMADGVIVMRDGQVIAHHGPSTPAQLLADLTPGGQR